MSPVTDGVASAGPRPYGERVAGRYDGLLPSMGLGAEMIAERWNPSRTQLDDRAAQPREGGAGAT